MRIFTLFLLLFVFTTGCATAPNNTEIYTSDKTIEERNALGNKHLGQVYRQIVKWTKEAAVIEDNVGEIIAIAPTSGVNRTSSSFADSPTGSITLEIVGEKETAIFEVTHITSCAWEIACFRQGILTIGDRALEIHQSGMSLEEFRQPENEIAYLTNQINWWNKHKDFIPEQSDHGAFRSWAKRARIHAANQDLKKAIFDMRIATILLGKREKEFNLSEPSQELLRYRQKLAEYYHCVGELQKSLEVINNIIRKHQLDEYELKSLKRKFSCNNI